MTAEWSAVDHALARATAPVADADDGWETTAAVLAHEVQRLRAWKREALLLFDGLQDLGRALELPLGTLVTGPRAVEAADALRVERDALRECAQAAGPTQGGDR